MDSSNNVGVNEALAVVVYNVDLCAGLSTKRRDFSSEALDRLYQAIEVYDRACSGSILRCGGIR